MRKSAASKGRMTCVSPSLCIFSEFNLPINSSLISNDCRHVAFSHKSHVHWLERLRLLLPFPFASLLPRSKFSLFQIPPSPKPEISCHIKTIDVDCSPSPLLFLVESEALGTESGRLHEVNGTYGNGSVRPVIVERC